jgi:hypothetical protein
VLLGHDVVADRQPEPGALAGRLGGVIGEDGYRRSFAALKRGGLLCAYGYTASVQARRRLVSILMWIARVYLWRRLLPGGKRLRIDSINLMRATRRARPPVRPSG